MNRRPTDPEGRKPLAGPLQRRLFMVVLAGVSPLALLAFFLIFQSARDHRLEILAAAQDNMRAVITAVDAEVDEAIASLDALAASPRLTANDLPAFRQEAVELLARRPGWLNVVLSDPSARQLMNARVPVGGSLPSRVDPASVADAVATGKPGVGNILFSPLLQTHAFAVRIPIMRDGRVVYVLSAIMRPSSMETVLKTQRMSEGGVVGIFDRDLNVVARTMNQSEWLGKPASPGMLSLLKRGEPSGWGRTRTLEGTAVYSVYWRSPVTGWSAAVGIPETYLNAPLRRSFLMLSGAIAGSVLIGFLAAFFVSRSITRPMAQLEEAAVAVGQGMEPVVPRTGVPEIQQAARALAVAHAEREQALGSEREARLGAERANRAKDEFLAMLGHELRNPLAAISNASSILERLRDEPSAQAEEAAKGIIRRQISHLSRLTDDLLDASRVMTGKIVLATHPVDLSAVVRHAVDTLRSTRRLEHHRLSLDLDPVWVKGDATRLDQIVTNLLTNAIKYTPPEGSIGIGVRRDGGEALICVRDSGVGLDPDLLPHVFDLFVQGKRSIDRSQGGLGIGLTLVRGLAELHGGRVSVDSAGPGTGSAFTVRLPAIAPPHSATSTPAPAAAERALRVVVVDDNEDVRTALKKLLELEGHEVHEAADGEAAVSTILAVQPDAAVIDIGLPLMDGYQVLRAVKGRTPAHTRLIALTGYGSAADTARGLAAGFDAYFVKPMDTAALLAALHSVGKTDDLPQYTA